MIVQLPQEFVDERIVEAFDLLTERLNCDVPMSEAVAMEFVRCAYMTGYEDSLAGVGETELERLRRGRRREVFGPKDAA